MRSKEVYEAEEAGNVSETGKCFERIRDEIKTQLRPVSYTEDGKWQKARPGRG